MSEYKAKDADLTDIYFGAFGTGTTGDPFYGIPADFNLEVKKGNVYKHTTFDKYGRNSDIDTGTAEDIWNGGTDYTGFPTGSAETMEIYSSDANDTVAGTGARTVTIYNLRDGTGAIMPDITVNMNGTTAVSLGAQTYYRGGTRMKVRTAGSGGENAGTLTLRHTTTTANIFAVMPIGMNQTAIAAYTVPLGYTLYIQRIAFQMARASGAAGSAFMSLRARPDGEVFQSIITPEITDSASYVWENNGFYKCEALTDIKVRCESVSDNNTIISADLGGTLVED